MNIDRFKDQHTQILDSIAKLRRHAHAGIAEHADQIAQLIVSMSAVIKLHLAAEDHTLYPALEAASNPQLARLGRQLQIEMASIAADYGAFARQWNTASQVRADPEGFRAQANQVLRTLYERIKHENHDFYPAVERSAGPLARTFTSREGFR
ncbi:hemerythrin domain-containing protein [Azohydromonas caseinilytica]|uniref:Hemerythrin domain-containing protein n=1 Tax=Azohydromonas caseinilytica TaxID=2728836 RepID=A0A848FHH9_9BURK|nr:hemerythrin domain-containing protein [Azohydromonas caseinilytica]NML17301.1 hemerythrin domain-containing protein [Azohydromonas caseinilytica]